jgi:hypothetical protein
LTNKQQCDPEDSKETERKFREQKNQKKAVKKEGPGWS